MTIEWYQRLYRFLCKEAERAGIEPTLWASDRIDHHVNYLYKFKRFWDGHYAWTLVFQKPHQHSEEGRLARVCIRGRDK